ncbi:MAG: DUF2130 domain-containing protein [Nocardioides sp.]
MTTSSLKALPPFEESCPWCGQGIPHEQLAEIRERIQVNERAQTRAIERRLTEELDAKLSAAKAGHQATIDKLGRENAAVIKALRQEAEAAVAAAEAAVTEKHAAELQAAQEAKQQADLELATARAEHEKAITVRLTEQREALEQHSFKALNTEKARAFQERQKLEEQLAAVQRQLQKQTAGELGEGAEVDLYEELKRSFVGDDITRVKRGTPGADIVHKVMDSGRLCGIIVYDSKNRTAWRNGYVTKLHSDQLAAKADHAILASATFPAGSHQLHVQDGVVIANPARVIALVSILRKHLIQVATMRLSDDERAEKMAALYDYVISERFNQLFSRLSVITEDMLDLEVKEKRAHDNTWKKRGELIRNSEQTQGTLAAEIDRIVTAPTDTPEKAQ